MQKYVFFPKLTNKSDSRCQLEREERSGSDEEPQIETISFVPGNN